MRAFFEPARPEDRPFIERLAPEVEGHRVADWLQEPSVVTSVARRNGKAIGFVMVGVSDERWRPGAPAGTDLAEVLALVVAPELRRKGLGARLLDWALELAQAADAIRIEANIAEGATASEKIVTRAGFRMMGVEEACYPDGRRALRYGREV